MYNVYLPRIGLYKCMRWHEDRTGRFNLLGKKLWPLTAFLLALPNIHRTVQIRATPSSKNRYEVLNPIPRILSNTLGNPSQVPDLLFFQLHVTIEHAKLELL